MHLPLCLYMIFWITIMERPTGQLQWHCQALALWHSQGDNEPRNCNPIQGEHQCENHCLVIKWVSTMVRPTPILSVLA